MKEKKITAYKGFGKDMKCRGFQYEVGKDYEMDGDIKVCERGFHACENPMDVLGYYGDMLHNRYCVVEQSGNFHKDTDDSKIASSKINIKAEIGWEGLFKFGIEWLKEITNPEKVKTIDTSLNDNGGVYAQIGSSGYSARIGSSGGSARIGSSGGYAQIGSSGYSARIGSSGYSARIGSSGGSARIGSSGGYAQIGSSGGYARIGSSGGYAQIGSSGDSARIGSSGDYAQIGSSGDYAQIGSSGGYAQIGSSGGSAQIGSSGGYAQIGSSGDSARINSTGETSVIMCAGLNSTVKAKVGSWITLSEWKEEKGRNIPVCVKTEYVDGERIKADTWYRLENGDFKEVM